MRHRHPRVYSTLKRTFTAVALQQLGFRLEGSLMVRRGICRTELARASSTDGQQWRVTPLVRRWRPGGRL